MTNEPGDLNLENKQLKQQLAEIRGKAAKKEIGKILLTITRDKRLTLDSSYTAWANNWAETISQYILGKK